MPFLVMTRGLPGSGKSTWAEQYVKLNPNTTIINKDDIRKELTETGWKWSNEAESDVIAIRDARIIAALAVGRSVVSSDTNFGKHEARLREIAIQNKADFVIKDLTNVPVETCIERDATRANSVGPEVIKRMYNQYLASAEITPYAPVEGTPHAVICDLDGTLALGDGHRGPFDYAKCAKDAVNKPVYELIRLLHDNGYSIVYMSGREDWCRFQTEDFLATNKCPKGPLFMRKSKDYRKDFIVKRELFDKHVRQAYNVRFVLDDRDQVVNMWRKLGLTCLQVADGAF